MRLLIAYFTLWMSWLALVSADDYKVVCYFGSWAGYRSGVGKFDPEDIDPTLCTHVIYAFTGITEDGNVSILDPWNDLADDEGKNGFGRFIGLRDISEDTKFLVSIGSWNEGSDTFSAVANNATLRSTFVDNVVEFLLYYGFDGFDVDWEYPRERYGVSDPENFSLLLAELRQRFDEYDFILTAAVAAPEESWGSYAYDIPEISKHLDLINVMTYDYYGSWDPTSGHNSPLRAAKRGKMVSAPKRNVEASVNYWLSAGAPANKIMMGTPFHGKTFTLNNTSEYEPGSPIRGPGNAGEITRQKGMLAYYEICQLEANPSWTFHFDEEQLVPYGHSGDQWVSYDIVKSIEEKARYIKETGLGGAMVWSIDLDDFSGVCGEKYPLLHALNDELRNGI